MAGLGELEAAATEVGKVADELIKIKKLVFLMLRSQGVISFDASESELSPDMENLIKGRG